jgi:hypothetical protein
MQMVDTATNAEQTPSTIAGTATTELPQAQPQPSVTEKAKKA